VAIVTQPSRGRVRVVGSWSGRDGGVAAGEAAMRRLRGRCQGGAVRQALRTLVVLAAQDRAAGWAALATARRAVGAAGAPGRTVLAVSAPRAETGTDVAVSVHAVEHPGRETVCAEEVVLVARGAAAGHVAAVVRPWLLPGLPLAVWLTGRPLRWAEPLVAEADRVIVDTRRLTGGAGLADIALLLAANDDAPVCDLAWARQHDWRKALAGLFTGRDVAAGARVVEWVEVAGRRPEAALLAGWLAGALGLPPDAVGLADAERTAVRIGAAPGDRRAMCAVEEVDDDRQERALRVTTSVGTTDAATTPEAGPTHRRIVRLGPQTLAADLDRALGAAGRDPAWWAALVAATDMSSCAPTRTRGVAGPPGGRPGT
jgi:Glucose-6-phosphate dehydrogenase subunit